MNKDITEFDIDSIVWIDHRFTLSVVTDITKSDLKEWARMSYGVRDLDDEPGPYAGFAFSNEMESSSHDRIMNVVEPYMVRGGDRYSVDEAKGAQEFIRNKINNEMAGVSVIQSSSTFHCNIPELLQKEYWSVVFDPSNTLRFK